MECQYRYRAVRRSASPDLCGAAERCCWLMMTSGLAVSARDSHEVDEYEDSERQSDVPRGTIFSHQPPQPHFRGDVAGVPGVDK
jgi:hypothetical protein